MAIFKNSRIKNVCFKNFGAKCSYIKIGGLEIVHFKNSRTKHTIFKTR